MARTTIRKRQLRATDARGIVLGRVARRAREFPALFPSPLDVGDLDDRDTALAYAIDQAVARHWLTLVAVLAPRIRRRWDQLHPTVQSSLLVGAAQLLLLERVPDHAAINESVRWVKTRSPAAAPLVNAVLHRVAELRTAEPEPASGNTGWQRDELPLPDGRIVRLAEPVFDEDPLKRLAEQTSHPPQLVQRWADREGPEAAARLAAHSLVHPPILLTGALPGIGWPSHDHDRFAVWSGSHSELVSMLDNCPGIRVQDPASAAAAEATAGLAADLIVEVCAGKGTQTRQLSELHPTARIVATDANAEKLSILRDVFRGHDRVRVVEPEQLTDLAGQVDLLVVDAPCSNTAVLARRVEARYRASPDSITELVGIQRQVLADSLQLPGPAGHVLYSTCSLEPEENEQQAAWLIKWHRFRIVAEARSRPVGGPGDPPTSYRDGSYHVLARRS
jgi:16S rRNA (cytosine967-C5)-methyltransferase